MKAAMPLPLEVWWSIKKGRDQATGSVNCIPSSALTLMVRTEGHVAHKNSVTLIPSRSRVEWNKSETSWTRFN